MPKKSYSDKLKDPRWQKKRLEALENAGFACQECGDGETELHVHHLIYRKGCDPWGYHVDDLCVLCKPCHDSLHIAKKRLESILSPIVTPDHIDRIAGYALALTGDVWPHNLPNTESKAGYADCYRTTISVVEYLQKQAEGGTGPMSPTVILARQTI